MTNAGGTDKREGALVSVLFLSLVVASGRLVSVVWSLVWSSGFSRLLSLVRSLSSGLSSLSRLSFVDSRLVTHLIRSLVFSDLSSSLVFLSSLLSHLHSPLTCWQRNLPVHFLAMLRFHRCVRPSVLLLSVCLHVHNTYNSPHSCAVKRALGNLPDGNPGPAPFEKSRPRVGC